MTYTIGLLLCGAVIATGVLIAVDALRGRPDLRQTVNAMHNRLERLEQEMQRRSK